MDIWHLQCINMFIFSLNNLTPCRSKRVYLQPYKTNIHTAMFDTKQNNVDTKGTVAFFFWINKTSIYKTAFVPNFHLNRHHIFIYTFSLFINKFETQIVLFHVNKR